MSIKIPKEHPTYNCMNCIYNAVPHPYENGIRKRVICEKSEETKKFSTGDLADLLAEGYCPFYQKRGTQKEVER